MTDVSSQTDFDVVDALRINPFLLSKHPKNEERLPKLKRNVIPVVQKPTLRLSKPIEEECYSVENERRGICLVLEHDTFSPNLQLRYVLNFPQKWFFKPKCLISIFQLWHFPSFLVLMKLTCLVALFDHKFQFFKNCQNWPFFGIFIELLYTQNAARFARNVEWDFFCDFQTPWSCHLCSENVNKVSRFFFLV